VREAEKVQKRRKQREESRKTGPKLDIKKQEKRKKSKREESKERKVGKQGLNWT